MTSCEGYPITFWICSPKWIETMYHLCNTPQYLEATNIWKSFYVIYIPDMIWKIYYNKDYNPFILASGKFYLCYFNWDNKYSVVLIVHLYLSD